MKIYSLTFATLFLSLTTLSLADESTFDGYRCEAYNIKHNYPQIPTLEATVDGVNFHESGSVKFCSLPYSLLVNETKTGIKIVVLDLNFNSKFMMTVDLQRNLDQWDLNPERITTSISIPNMPAADEISINCTKGKKPEFPQNQTQLEN